MRVLRIDQARALALCVDDDGEHHTVEIALVDADIGDELLVHAGVALVRLGAVA
jgi:hydrogenase maturation factor